MIGTTLHWVEGPWAGRLAMAARPRGGDWLADEMSFWRESGVDTVVSLLESEEESVLGLEEEGSEAVAHGMRFRSLPIPDRDVPKERTKVSAVLDELDRELRGGRKVLLHCRQGVGRTGLVGVCLLVLRGLEADRAINRVSEARGVEVPETAEQGEWIERFAGTLAAAR